MSAITLLLELVQRGIQVDLVDDCIRCRYAPGNLPPTLAARVRSQRAAVIALMADPDALRLAAAQAILEVDIVRQDFVSSAAPLEPNRCWACGLDRHNLALPCLTCHPAAWQTMREFQ